MNFVDIKNLKELQRTPTQEDLKDSKNEDTKKLPLNGHWRDIMSSATLIKKLSVISHRPWQYISPTMTIYLTVHIVMKSALHKITRHDLTDFIL